MPETVQQFETCDPIWSDLRAQAHEVVKTEPMLASYLHASALNHERFEDALSYHLSQKLASAEMPAMLIRQVFDEALKADPDIGAAVRADLAAVVDRDPACDEVLTPFLYFKGFHALQSYRIAHWLWGHGREALALFFQNRISMAFGVDAHPAAKIGRGIMIDHATGVVIGETTVIENDVSILQGVTFGGTGKEHGDRHPKIREGALIGSGAKILGNVEVGAHSRVGANSVVLKPVPSGCTAAGVPAKIVGCAGSETPSRDMQHSWPEDAIEQ